MRVEQRILQFVQLAAIAIVAISCYEVIHPFIPAILFAVVVCISTWPQYLRLRKVLWGKSSLAALLMVLMVAVLVIGPFALLATSLADNVKAIIDATRAFLSQGPIDAPAWLKDTPLIGKQLDSHWHELTSGGDEAVVLLKSLLEPTRNILLSTASAIGASLLQMVFAIFIGFFFYRDGEELVHTLTNGLMKVAGGLGEKLLSTIHHTVASVVHGIFGAALAQSLVAIIGFFIAGVPGPLLLGAATFFLALVPIGPPLLWGGASIWLLYQGSFGWAVFMALWGVFAISSIDNVVKPYLISRDSDLSMLLATLGVFGGIVAFGFIGIFIGPPILAVGLTLTHLWTGHPIKETKASHQ